MVRIICIALLLSSCASFEQKLKAQQQLQCQPAGSVGCIGFILNKE